MVRAGGPQWVIREDAGRGVLVALYLRQTLGLRAPEELPPLRGVPLARADRDEPTHAALEDQWRAYWAMTVEPRAHRSSVPLDLVDGFDGLVALPVAGAEELRTAVAPYAAQAIAFSRTAHAAYTARDEGRQSGAAYRAYAGAIAEHERHVGRRAHSFELNVQILPLTQRGLWWIGALTIAVTDGLRRDVAAFDTAIHPVIAELA